MADVFHHLDCFFRRIYEVGQCSVNWLYAQVGSILGRKLGALPEDVSSRLPGVSITYPFAYVPRRGRPKHYALAAKLSAELDEFLEVLCRLKACSWVRAV